MGTYPAKGVGQGVVCSEKAFFFFESEVYIPS